MGQASGRGKSMRSILDISNLPNQEQKFQSPKGDSTFTIFHGTITFIVDVLGKVISPVGTPLSYNLTDMMEGVQSGYLGVVSDFLTTTADLDSNYKGE
jgi:hypothetical protein